MTDAAWLEDRRGYMSASVLHVIDGKPTNEGYQRLAIKLATEREGALMAVENAPARAMRFGKAWEERAVAIYKTIHMDQTVMHYGADNPKFFKWKDHHDAQAWHDAHPTLDMLLDALCWFGASPDATVNADGGGEFKLAMSVDVQAQRIIKDRPEPKHDRQCQGILLATGRQWIDFISYCPSIMPEEDRWFSYRYHRDDEYIGKLIVKLAAFNQRVEELRREMAA